MASVYILLRTAGLLHYAFWAFTTYSLCISCWLQHVNIKNWVWAKIFVPSGFNNRISFIFTFNSRDHTALYFSFPIWALNSTGLSTVYFGFWFSCLESPSYSAVTNWPTGAVLLQSPYKHLQGYLPRHWKQVQIWGGTGLGMSQGNLGTTHLRTTQTKAIPDNRHTCQKTHWQDTVDQAYSILEFHWYSLLLHTHLPSSQPHQRWRCHWSVIGCRCNPCPVLACPSNISVATTHGCFLRGSDVPCQPHSRTARCTLFLLLFKKELCCPQPGMHKGTNA